MGGQIARLGLDAAVVWNPTTVPRLLLGEDAVGGEEILPPEARELRPVAVFN